MENERMILQQLLILDRRQIEIQMQIEQQNARRVRRRRIMILMVHMIINSLTIGVRERQMWSKLRSSAWWETIVLNSWTNRDFKENFRVQRPTFDWICCKLQPYLERKNWKPKPVSVKRQVAITLMKLGSSAELRIIANLFGLATSTVCIIVNRVVRLMTQIFKINFPTGIENIALLFYENGGIPGCCGSLDGSHIPIKAPTDNPKNFFNRKQHHSIVLQGVVTGNCTFINVNAGWPGSVHDARVFSNSGLFRRGLIGNLLPQSVTIHGESYRTFLVADAAYPLLPWLMKPFGGQLNSQQCSFNQKLGRSRVKVEHAFGMLKGRFRCLLKKNESALRNVVPQVLACCALHNICIAQEDMYLEEWNDDVDIDMSEPEDDEVSEADAIAASTSQSGISASDVRESLLAFC